MRLIVPSGATAYFGRPARPIDAGVSQGISALLGSIPEVVEAYLPQAWVPGVMAAPAQVLVVLLSECAVDSKAVENQVGESSGCFKGILRSRGSHCLAPRPCASRRGAALPLRAGHRAPSDPAMLSPVRCGER